jgi:hypothetical protein
MSEFLTSEGTMLTFRAGEQMLWSNLLTVVAGATAGRWNTVEDTHPVGMDGSSLRKALNVALVSLTLDGIVPFDMPMRILCCAVSGSIRYVVRSLGGRLRRQVVLFLLT